MWWYIFNDTKSKKSLINNKNLFACFASTDIINNTTRQNALFMV